MDFLKENLIALLAFLVSTGSFYVSYLAYRMNSRRAIHQLFNNVLTERNELNKDILELRAKRQSLMNNSLPPDLAQSVTDLKEQSEKLEHQLQERNKSLDKLQNRLEENKNSVKRLTALENNINSENLKLKTMRRFYVQLVDNYNFIVNAINLKNIAKSNGGDSSKKG